MLKTLIIASVFAFSTFVSANEEVTLMNDVSTVIDTKFQASDLNLDGLISLEEAEIDEALIKAFSTLDLDGTGDLTKDEFSQFIKQ